MTRKPKRGSGEGRTVKISVAVPADEHMRLAALALATHRTITDVVLDAVRPHLATVRIPWVVSAGRSDEPAASEPTRAAG